MNLESLRNYCYSLPLVTEDVKWKTNLCFMVSGKIFCIAGFDSPFQASLKVGEEEYEELSAREGIMPAPYLARYKWILVKDSNALNQNQWEHYISQSYELVKAKIKKRIMSPIPSNKKQKTRNQKPETRNQKPGTKN